MTIRPRDFANLILIAALWGGSYLFIRTTVPVFGPWLMLLLRMSLATFALLLIARLVKQTIEFTPRWRQHLFTGLMGSVLAQALLAYAAYRLTAGILAILAASAPMWSALIAKLYGHEALGRRRALGLLLGPLGVGLVVGFAPIAWDGLTGLAVLAAVVTPLFYAIGNVYIARRMREVDSLELAVVPQLLAAGLLLPMALATLPTVWPSGAQLSQALLGVAYLGIAATALAGWLYVRLLKRSGPTTSLSVMFLAPAFSLFWGWLFLGETLNLRQAAGCGVILVALLLVTRVPVLAPAWLRRPPPLPPPIA